MLSSYLNDLADGFRDDSPEGSALRAWAAEAAEIPETDPRWITLDTHGQVFRTGSEMAGFGLHAGETLERMARNGATLSQALDELLDEPADLYLDRGNAIARELYNTDSLPMDRDEWTEAVAIDALLKSAEFKRWAMLAEGSAVLVLRDKGWSWQRIAVALRTSKQALHQRYGREDEVQGD